MKKIYISLSLALALALSANAKEELTKEITIEKDFVPTEQKVTKTNVLPAVKSIIAPSKALEFTDWSAPITLSPMIPTLNPYGYKTKYDFSNKRGYFDLGAGYFMNIIGSAGYKFIDTDNFKLKAWLQHSSTWSGKNHSLLNQIPNAEFQKQKFNDNVIGVDMSNRFWVGTLDVNAFYHFDHFNYYGGIADKWKQSQWKQTINEMHLKAGWTSAKQEEGFSYKASLMYNHFGYSHSLITNYKSIHENNFRLNGNASVAVGESSFLGMDLNADYAYYTNPVSLQFNDMEMIKEDNKGLGVITFSPYFKYKSSKANIRLGVNVDLAINDGTVLKFSPNAKLDYNLLDGFSVYLSAQGGKKLTLLSDINSINRYTNPSYIFGSVYSPLDGELGFLVGPFSGFTAKLYGGYGIFNNQQLPWIPSVTMTDPANDFVYASTFLRGIDMKGWKVGAELGYKFKNFVDFIAGIKYSPQDNKKGFVFGLDRPKYVIDAQIKVYPIEKLSLSFDYQLRAKRANYSYYIYNLTPPATESWAKTALGDVNLLNVGAYYQINDTFGAFIQANNILNKNWDNFYGMSAQKFNALGGISILF